MKKPLMLILYYLWILLLCCLIGSFIYIQFFGCVKLVAGQRAAFSWTSLAFGFLESFPVVFFLLGMLVTLYKIRHLGSPVLSAVVYALLCAMTWLLLFPALLSLKNFVYGKIGDPTVVEYEAPLSGGYFRQSGDGLYYFIDDSEGGQADVLVVNRGERPDSFGDYERIDVSADSQFARNSAPFRDPLIQESMSGLTRGVFSVFADTKRRALSAWDGGIPVWLCFCALGFALCSVYSFIHVSTWRLINSFCVVSLEALVLWGNALYFSPVCSQLRAGAEEFLADRAAQLPPLFAMLGDEFFPMTFNFLLGIVILVSGSTITAVRHKEN